MEHIDEQDLLRLKELLRRTGEFIAYFELAETKMVEWRQEIEHHTSAHQQQVKTLQSQLHSLQEILTVSGLANFRLAAEDALNQSKEYLLSIQKSEQQIAQELTDHQRELAYLSEQTSLKLTEYTNQAIERIESQLSQYDAQQFHRIACESAVQIENSARNALVKSGKMLRLFQWRAVALVFFVTLLTIFTIGLYISDEYPWEIHQHVLNERGAGRLLISAWPKLTLKERTKILEAQGFSSS